MPIMEMNNFVTTNPKIKKPRSVFDLSHTVTEDFSAGHLIPITVVPTLPGDTFKVDVASLVRMLTPQKPFMDNIFCDVFAFFVPDRITWKHAKAYYSGSTDKDPNTGSGDYTHPTNYTRPRIKIRGDYSVSPCCNLDYLGVIKDSVGGQGAGNYVYVDGLPLRGMAMIWNRFFRDQNLQQAVLVDTGDTCPDYVSGATTANGSMPECKSYATFQTNAMKGWFLFPVNRKQDYFSTALPAPLKGNDVLMDLSIPQSASGSIGNPVKVISYTSSSGNVTYEAGDEFDANQSMYQNSLLSNGNTPIMGFSDLKGGTINSLIQAFAINDLLTKDARYGSRYSETLYGQFGETVSSDLVDDPVYLGGKRFNINVSQVLQTSNGSATDNSIGALGANSVSHDASQICTASFKEHGYFFLFAAVRFEHKYSSGGDAFWFKKDRLDHYWPALNSISDQPIFTKELYNTVSNQQQIFGYKEAWSEYRFQNSRVKGHFRPQVEGSLDPWTLADAYSSEPTLSADWIREPWELLDRVSYAQTSKDIKQFLGDFYVKITATRTIGTYSIPGGLTGRF